MTYGNKYADWTFCPNEINEDSILYSFGVGEDISFDLQMIESFRVHVHAFDPSPDSIRWMENQKVPGKFHFYPFGLAHEDGNVSFTEPADPGLRSLRMTDPGQQDVQMETTHNLQVHRLPTILGKLGHDRIDILKMDIESAEYKVITDIISSPVPILQVLIEFHHRFENIGIQQTKKAIASLNAAGYMIFNVAASGEEISFIKTDA